MELDKVVMGAVGVGMFVMVVTGGGTLLNAGGNSFLGGGGLSIGGGMSDRADDDLLWWDLSMGKLHPKGIATADGYDLIRNVAAEHPGEARQEPTAIVPLLADDCTARAPAAGEVIANVYGAVSYFESGIHAVTHAQLMSQAEDWLERQVKDLTKPRPLPSGRLQTMDIVDVYVTDTSAPVYLILQSDGNGLAWNLQIAPGVELAQVTVVAQQTVGVANVPMGVPLDLIGTGCGVDVTRMPKAQWDFVENTRNGIGGSHSQELLDAHYDRAGRYADWFYGVFGVDPERGTAGFGKQSYVLAGPLPAPEALLDYTPMGVMHVTDTALILTGTKQERQSAKIAAIEEILVAAIHGPVTDLQYSEPMLREATAMQGDP